MADMTWDELLAAFESDGRLTLDVSGIEWREGRRELGGGQWDTCLYLHIAFRGGRPAHQVRVAVEYDDEARVRAWLTEAFSAG